MPTYYVGKGTQFGVLDMFDGTNAAVYEAALNQLSSSKTLVQLANERMAAGGALTGGDIRHFENDWVGTEWWAGLNVELVLRGGIRKALEVALFLDADAPPENRAPRPAPLPVEVLWVCSEEQVFHVYVNEGKHQVTIVVYTPPPKYPDGTPGAGLDERIWVVKTRDTWDDKYPPSAAPIRRVNPEDEWPVLIERRLQYPANPA
jgi:hypothetical protein